MDFLVDYLSNFYGATPYLVVLFVLLICGLGVPMPEDIILFVAGVLCFYGSSQVWLMILVALAGVLIGDSTIFFLGHKYGRRLTKKWIFHRLLPDHRLEAVKTKFHKRGNKLIFAARFMPGLRAPIFFSAGTLHLPYRVFLFYDGIAALISVPTIIYTVYHFGDTLDKTIQMIKRVQHGITFVVFAVVLIFAAKWYLNHRKKAA